ncbi:MAG TPA: SMP-30/gluconolactonase/LRE family protein, partial [Bryobacteraceae bacterium]|nr:SMP-30/gluconolactonase/LRE family protein [Bryobacteraceae bacterium]
MTRRNFGSARATAWLAPDSGRREEVRKLAGGFIFTEGPVCNAQGDLYFSDVGAERIYCLSKGVLRVVRNSSNLANGLAFDPEGRLIVCERGRLTRTDADGRFAILAESHEGKGLHCPNDLVVRSDGAVFFTDLKQKNEWANPAKTGRSAVYNWVAGRGVSLFADDCREPNGVALSPREDLLYVSDTASRCIREYALGSSGIQKGRILAKTSDSGGPDGLETDAAGNIWVCESEGVVLLDTGGKRLGVIQLPESPSNCAFCPSKST